MAREVDRSSVDELLRAVAPSRVAEALGIAVVRRGANLRCLCPFHDDHDPSMVLYENWDTRPPHHHCFVCGADGDIFDMVRHVRHASFAEAAEWLRSTFSIPQRKTRTGPGSNQRKVGDRPVWDGTSQAAFKYAANVYHRASADFELSGWLASRNLPEDIAKKASLSYARSNTLTGEVVRASIDPGQGRIEEAMLEQIGLLRRVKRTTDSNQLFAGAEPRFRDFFFDARVVFPIHTLEGDVVGFAGRAVKEVQKDSPKYLYSPGFAKSKVLYRGNAALELLKGRSKAGEHKEIFVCEGLVDALRLESLGHPAVSILGAQASKEQIEQLRRIADSAAPAGDLLVHIFLDRDKAGVRGSAKLALALAEAGFDADFVWPSKTKLTELGVSTDDEKDPDSLISALDGGWTEAFIQDSIHPTALPVVASKLESLYSLDAVLDDDVWRAMSLGVRYRAAMGLTRNAAEASFLLNLGLRSNAGYKRAWFSDIEALRSSSSTSAGRALQDEGYSAEFIADEASRLNNARVLAKSGADRGEVPTDEAAWRRLESGATAFNVGLRERLQEATFEPLEPFDAVFVARDFDKQEPRLKTMPCPEDLVLQQYMLSETLTERFDVLSEEACFSRSIPAVRFYRGRRATVTTAESGTPGTDEQTLSFAYQIDMDVLEGRSKAANQGMFRPYIECWREFIGSLRATANGFDEVYALRLDLKRYYDRLYRSTVRDALREPFKAAFERLDLAERREEFAPSFSNGRQNLSDSLVDWFCEQSFGYQYYHPETGRIAKCESSMGIPQGPVLSAWLATVALFPLDAELRKLLKRFNSENALPHAGYARYVDDIFLVADSPQVLEELRAAVEDACTRLRLEAIPKGDLAPRMTPEEFSELLTEGKALIGSGPAREIGLLELGDGEAGFETWQDPIQRASALVLLSDRRLYEADTESIQRQVFTALNAHDLRPAELSKAARWTWYAVAKEGHQTSEDAWRAYWSIWSEVTERLAPRMKVEVCPWLDPSLYALDGLEQLLRSANSYDRNLSFLAESQRKAAIAALSNLVVLDGFFTELAAPKATPPRGAGKGVLKLRRMFVQRSVCVRWIARQLRICPTSGTLSDELGPLLGLASDELNSSLARAWLTDADGTSSDLEIKANVGNRLDYTSPLRPLFLWLHEAIVLLGRDWGAADDPLSSIRGKLTEPVLLRPGAGASEFFGLLNLWKPDLAEHELVMLGLRLDALAALLAVCHVDGLIHCLPRRKHLLGEIGEPVPALPGIRVGHLVLKNANHEGTQLRTLTQIFPGGSLPASVAYRMATPDGTVSVQPVWSDVDLPIDIARLAARKTAWAGSANKIRKTQPSKVADFGCLELQWAADCFDALARVNHELEHDMEDIGAKEPMEFVPAWPFISASHWVEDFDSGEAAFSLFGPVVPRSYLANFAFARDGKGRLRAHEVPLADARLWRIGYAVTDALGMVDDLERFQALEQDGKAVDINTAQYVLSRLLGRLRGEGHPSTPGLPHPTCGHLTGATYRAVQLLRSFPTSRDAVDEVQFLLAVETETAAMRLQADGHSDVARPGVLTSMLAEIAPAVFSRLTAKQLGALPECEVVEGPNGPERRVVTAWRLIDRRLGKLESGLVRGIPDQAQSAWTALRRSVRVAAVSAWARALVFEMNLAGDATTSTDVNVPPEWELEDAVLAIDSAGINIGALFRDALAPKGRLGIVAKVTPLGWLALLTTQLNLYGTDSSKAVLPEEHAEKLRPAMTSLARQLGSACPDDELAHEKWPFGANSHIDAVLDEDSFKTGLALFVGIQSALGYRVRTCKSHIWGLQPQSKSFTDESGRQWPHARGLIEQVGRDRHVEIDEVETSQRVWTQTNNRDGKLIGVSVLGETFARTAGTQGKRSLFDGDGLPSKTASETENPVRAPIPPKEGIAKGTTREAQDASSVASTKDEIAPDKPLQPTGTDGSKDATLESGLPSAPGMFHEKFFKRLREVQEREWRTRRTAKSAGHVRFAVFQFRIDDSYYHPIVDAGFPDNIDRAFCNEVDIDSTCGAALAEMAGERAGVTPTPPTTSSAQRARASLSKEALENQWDRAELVPSWNEHRRRRLIDEAIRACHEFSVDVLVLPEYSVRPDTVEWLRERLTNLPNAKLSVVAGTYRLHGSPRDLHFTKSFENIFGTLDKQKVFATGGNSMEKSAYITLLQPIQNDVPGAVGVFSRRKKFHSMAMGEFINPSGEDWAPLASLEGLVSATEEARAAVKAQQLDVRGVTALAQQIRPVERMAELICSELFASTHPVNHGTIRSEYRALRQRFGYDPGDVKYDPVFKDIENLTAALQLDGRPDRRTILVVPACTTRSADYWIYGQSALLAAGLTTVFCAAVLTDAKTGLKGGGSCVIAKSSWSTAREAPGHLLAATPYSGWSRGIYYNRSEDVLTRKEQAVVIVDIDPIYMNEGKPRPQALPTPVQLVAHLPVVEMLDEARLVQAYTPENGGFVPASAALGSPTKAMKIQEAETVAKAFQQVSAFLTKVGPARLVDSRSVLTNGKELFDEAKAMAGFFSEPSGWTNRLECWSRNWREMPFYGPPPTLIDWLPVDLSPIEGKLPTVFVPPWGADFGGSTSSMFDRDET
ncbi:CHC2 zinc finger domain-containing protein [Paucibacter sp. DJ2R-2]|uniref:CHC2 zinc finger domain-containing protein n=1 Tax=Paucibacter sp. DJ2R-2 TaxID=2893558 RepID=UPI0021E35B69|nr:CHC2 zinc finger domain-containing protein [Paucibacter sp. DJ2R-2]MCV2437182.1 CHC2 zinc finger domain-containing protein [Paucibacter sp. DJ2R-2]